MNQEHSNHVRTTSKVDLQLSAKLIGKFGGYMSIKGSGKKLGLGIESSHITLYPKHLLRENVINNVFI